MHVNMYKSRCVHMDALELCINSLHCIYTYMHIYVCIFPYLGFIGTKILGSKGEELTPEGVHVFVAKFKVKDFKVCNIKARSFMYPYMCICAYLCKCTTV